MLLASHVFFVGSLEIGYKGAGGLDPPPPLPPIFLTWGVVVGNQSACLSIDKHLTADMMIEAFFEFEIEVFCEFKFLCATFS